MVGFCCQLPQRVGRMKRIFPSKTAPGIHSISPFSDFPPYFITGFQSCYSVSGMNMWAQPICNWGKLQGFKVLSNLFQSFFILSSYLSSSSSTSSDPWIYCSFLQIHHHFSQCLLSSPPIHPLSPPGP